MWIKTIVLTTVMALAGLAARAQVYVKSEYIPYSDLKDVDGNKPGGKADLRTIDAGAKIPLSIKTDENGRPTAWAVALSGTYASMDGAKGLSREYYMPEILNAQIGLVHMRPLSVKWSMIAMLGAGVFTSDPDHISGKAILGQGGVLFIRHAKPNFDWGFGVAVNNALGYPMIFPSFYLDWRLEGRFEFNVSMYNSFVISLKMRINDNFKVGMIAESKGLMSAVKKDGRDMYYIAQYGYAGIQPEYRIAKSLAVFAVGGVSYTRDTYFQSRSLKSLFNGKDDYPHFGAAPYFAVGIKYGF